jgi:hypothetical protein
MDFPEFCRSVQHFVEMNLDSCLKFVAQHHFGRIKVAPGQETRPRLFFLGVDELMKFPKYKDLVIEVGKTMDAVWQLKLPNRVGTCPMIVLPVVTSLSSEAVRLSLRDSDRSMSWIPLGPLRGAADHIARLDSRLSLAGETTLKALRILCADLGEHGRMLEHLVDYLWRDDCANLKLFVRQNLTMVTDILTALQTPCNDYVMIPRGTTKGLSIVSAALLGQPVFRLDAPAGCDLTYDDLQKKGIYISSEASGIRDDMFTPVMSPFQLLNWARATVIDDDLICTAYKVAEVLLRVMRRDSAVGGVEFDKFICGTCLYTFSVNGYRRYLDYSV